MKKVKFLFFLLIIAVNSILAQTDSLLVKAVKENNLEQVKKLVKNGANANSKDKYGYSVLQEASCRGYYEIFKILIANGADINTQTSNENRNFSALHFAIYRNNIKNVKFLIDKGADIELKINSEKHHYNGLTALHLALLEDKDDIAKLLIKSGANVNTKDKKGNTPLHYAVKNVRINVIKFLLENNANVNVKNKYEISPLDYAFDIERPDIADVLIDYGANVPASNKELYTKLFRAFKSNNLKEIKRLIKEGADVNSLYYSIVFGYRTPLSHSITYHNFKTAKYLINHNANIEIALSMAYCQMYSPLNFCVKLGKYDMVKFLLKHGANPNLKFRTCNKNEGWTTLHFAAKYGNAKMVKLLLKYNANLKIKDKKGKIPEDVARANNKMQIVEALTVSQNTDILVDKRDGKEYKTIKIGNKIWMAENLAYKPKKGNYSVVNNNKENVIKYGYLYDWETAQKVVPKGWRLPTKEDFVDLMTYYFQMDSSLFYILTSDTMSGFNSTFPGKQSCGNDFKDVNNSVRFWTSTELDLYGKARYFCISRLRRKTCMGFSPTCYKFSVRCVKKQPSPKHIDVSFY